MDKKPFFRFAALIAASWIIILSCSKSSSYGNNPPVPPPSAPNSVSMSGMTFSPATLTVKTGTVVKWTNNDSYAHTVTSNDGKSFDSGNIAGSGTYTFTTSTVGTFDYHCTIHGLAMSGTLIVTQ